MNTPTNSEDSGTDAIAELKPCPFCGEEPHLEGVIACLEDDAAQVRLELANCRPNGEGFICEEWADNMERAAKLLRALTPSIELEKESSAAPAETALDKFNKEPDMAQESPLERLRDFLSHALNGQDWLDVEPFLDALGMREDGNG